MYLGGKATLIASVETSLSKVEEKEKKCIEDTVQATIQASYLGRARASASFDATRGSCAGLEERLQRTSSSVKTRALQDGGSVQLFSVWASQADVQGAIPPRNSDFSNSRADAANRAFGDWQASLWDNPVPVRHEQLHLLPDLLDSNARYYDAAAKEVKHLCQNLDCEKVRSFLEAALLCRLEDAIAEFNHKLERVASAMLKRKQEHRLALNMDPQGALQSMTMCDENHVHPQQNNMKTTEYRLDGGLEIVDTLQVCMGRARSCTQFGNETSRLNRHTELDVYVCGIRSQRPV